MSMTQIHASDLTANALSSAFAKCKRTFFYVGLFSLCANVLLIALPLYSLQVLDRVISSHSMETLAVLTIITLVMFVFYTLFTNVRALILNRISEWLDLTLAPRLLSIAITKSAMITQTSAGQLHRDLGSIRGFIAGAGMTTLFDAPWAVLYLVVLFMISPILGMITCGGCALMLLFALITEFITKKPTQQASRIAIKSLQIADTASREAEVIEAMGMTRNIINHWHHHNSEGLAIQSRINERLNIIQSISRFVRMALQIAITAVGAYLALQNEMTVGGMIASSILAGRALGPFEGAIGTWKSLTQARDAYQRILRNILTTPDLRGTIALPAPQGFLQVENIFYKPQNREAHILKGVSFQLQPGESVGIIGPSAAGKSTLARLIVGIMPPSHGTIRLDAAETYKWNREDIGQYVGYMPQDVELFMGTIKDNIARMDLQAPAQKVIEAAQLAGVHEMILRLPKGYETEFSPNDLSLSPGQRQRIALARALYSNPRFVILDEPNANLDSDGERALVQCLARLKEARIGYIVVAHRPSIVSNVDKILMMRGGMAERFGPRDAVLQKYTAAAQQEAIAAGTA